MSKLQEIQTIREALDDHLSKIDGQCTHFSTNEGRSIKQIQEMHERLLTKCEDILKGLHAQYPNSIVLIDQIKKMAKGAEQVYPYEHVYGDDRVFPIKKWDFWHQHINDGDIFKKRKCFFAFKADLLTLMSEYAKPDNLTTKNGKVIKDVEKRPSALTHRQHALIYKYKAAAGYITPNTFNGTEIEKKFGPKRKQAFYSVWDKNGSTYRHPTLIELEIVIAGLLEFPLAKKAAINDLDQIKNS